MIRERSFPRTTANRVGAELEWFTTPSFDPPDVATVTHLLSSLELPAGSALSFEPGGQVELSSVPFDTVGETCDALACDTRVVEAELASKGTGLFAAGLDPDRPHRLLTDAPRYVAMRRYLDTLGPAGGRMMCAAAAIHVNLDAGSDDEGRRRWRTAHLIGPMLVAAFANSPRTEEGVTGWKSSRMEAWLRLDPTRTEAVAEGGPSDPADAWAKYALDARVAFIRVADRFEPLVEPLTLERWISDGHALGHPTADDVEYHLTTLFPPVRPRGYIELRMIDMLPDPWWRAAVALTTALVCDRAAQASALEACAPTEGLWDIAARCGLDDPQLRASAAACFPVALDALDRIGCDTETKAAAHAYVERYTEVGLCPADELIQPKAEVV